MLFFISLFLFLTLIVVELKWQSFSLFSFARSIRFFKGIWQIFTFRAKGIASLPSRFSTANFLSLKIKKKEPFLLEKPKTSFLRLFNSKDELIKANHELQKEVQSLEHRLEKVYLQNKNLKQKELQLRSKLGFLLEEFEFLNGKSPARVTKNDEYSMKRIDPA